MTDNKVSQQVDNKQKGAYAPMTEKNENIQEENQEIDSEATESNIEIIDNAQETSEDSDEYNDDMTKKIEELNTKLEESEDKYLRLLAEYDNFRKRTAKEKIEAFGNASAKCIESILPVMDSFERAVLTECADEAYKNGMDMIFNQFKSALEKLDIKEVPALGEDFDPNIHNAITKVDNEEFESGKICQVYQKGYKIGDRLIRPAMVAVVF